MTVFAENRFLKSNSNLTRHILQRLTRRRGPLKAYSIVKRLLGRLPNIFYFMEWL